MTRPDVVTIANIQPSYPFELTIDNLRNIKFVKVNPKRYGLKNQHILVLTDMTFGKLPQDGSHVAVLITITHDQHEQLGGPMALLT
eukprot:10325341-Heterocapsa_arctica.AAC.1